MNIFDTTIIEYPQAKLAGLFQLIGQPARIQLILALGTREVCVCHLEAVLGRPQSYVSQHLMRLRELDVVRSRRDGRLIYYRLSDPAWLDVISTAAQALQLPEPPVGHQVIEGCCCPDCSKAGAG